MKLIDLKSSLEGIPFPEIMLSFFLSFYQKLSDNQAIIWINSRIKPVSIVTGLDAVKMADVKAKMPVTSSKLADINQAL